MKNRALSAHLSMLTAAVIWGLMAPVNKEAMQHGVDGLTMVSFRVMGGAVLFWLLSFCLALRRRSDTETLRKEPPVRWREKLMFGLCAILGVICNQCGFTIGLSFTSPTNASIITTALPIFTMILSFVILHEPITWRKGGGVALGCVGAVLLVLTSARAGDGRVGDIRGDLMVLGAQLSYALFLTLLNRFVRRFSVVTVNKWMFLWATVLIWPFTLGHLMHVDWASVPLSAWLETAYVVVLGTFVGYLLLVVAQQVLRPTVVSIYNYVQPIVSVTVSVLAGIAVFTWPQAISVVFVFAGVALVTKSRSRHDMASPASQKR